MAEATADVVALIASTIARFGRLDVAVNNAGTEGALGPIPEQTETNYHATFDTNVLGVLLCLKHELPVMLAQGSGSIINLSSVAGQIGFAGASVYVRKDLLGAQISASRGDSEGSNNGPSDVYRDVPCAILQLDGPVGLFLNSGFQPLVVEGGQAVLGSWRAPIRVPGLSLGKARLGWRLSIAAVGVSPCGVHYQSTADFAKVARHSAASMRGPLVSIPQAISSASSCA